MLDPRIYGRRIYDVSAMGHQWMITERTLKEPIAVFDRKEEAIRWARMVAEMQGLARLLVRKQDGTIHLEYSYGEDLYLWGGAWRAFLRPEGDQPACARPCPTSAPAKADA